MRYINPRFTYLLNYLLIWTGLTWRRCMLKPEGDGCCTTIDVDDTELNVLSVWTICSCKNYWVCDVMCKNINIADTTWSIPCRSLSSSYYIHLTACLLTLSLLESCWHAAYAGSCYLWATVAG